MPWERTLLINYVGEPDAPTKSAKAYLSNLVFQMLYAMPPLPLTIRLCFRTLLFYSRSGKKESGVSLKTADRFWGFCNDFFALSL